jgi:hypothetical protein
MKKQIVPALIIAAAILTGGVIGRSTASSTSLPPPTGGIPVRDAELRGQLIQTNILLAEILEIDQARPKR